MTTDTYPHLFSPLRIRNTILPNRVAFAPVCPTWVRSPHEGIFTDQAVAYYEERAKTGLGMIILGGHLIDKNTIYTPMGFPGLWNDAQLEGLANVARAVKRHGCALSVQLLHLGLRSPTPFLKTDPARDPYEYDPYMLAPSQMPAGEIPGGPTPKELEEHEIEYILQCFEDAAKRAISAGLDGVEFHIAHGYLPWQFLSPFYNHRKDRWGGSYENRLRFSIEAMRRIRKRIGDRPFIGYRINSTSFWEGDLEIEDIKRIHADFEKATDIDYVSVSAGVHHSWIHTPMTFEEGWERQYTRAIKSVSTKPVLLVGRVSHPGVAEELVSSGDADAILLARQMIADEQWMTKVKAGRVADIRRCVAANYCWRAVIRGSRVQCAYNPVVGREGVWGTSATTKASSSKRVVVVGAGPAGLEFARVAAARGHDVVVYEGERHVGGHVRAYGALPNRQQYGTIATWLAAQASGNGAIIKTDSPVTAENIDDVLSAERPDHIVVATGARYRKDGFQGQTGKPIPGWETGRCLTWDEVALDKVKVSGEVLVIDELADVAAPLTAVKLAKLGHKVRLLTKWPMIGMETAAEVYLHWILTYLYEADVEMIADHAVKRISGREVEIVNIYQPARARPINADAIVMATARSSENSLYHLLRERGRSVEFYRLRHCPADGVRSDFGRTSLSAQAWRSAVEPDRGRGGSASGFGMTERASLTARRGGPLKGRVRVPGDKSISHRAVILGALTVGECSISGLLEGDDVLNTAKAVIALGATVNRRAEGKWDIHGVGVGGFAEPGRPLDFGNSGTGCRLMLGAVGGSPITAIFDGDASLRRRPMQRVLEPLHRIGARTQTAADGCLPVTLTGASDPIPIVFEPPVPSAQLKSAVLLAGLSAPGQTVVVESEATRDHTEKMLAYFGADVRVEPEGNLGSGRRVTLTGQPELVPAPIVVPADPSSAAFPLVAAIITRGSDIILDGVMMNPLRTGLLTTLGEMGASIERVDTRTEGGEEVADLRIRSAVLHGVDVPPYRAPAMIDEYPILAVAASFAEGETRMRGLKELRVKESDRLAATAAMLRTNGVEVEIEGDDLIVRGRGRARGGGQVMTHMDHRIAMSGLVIGLASEQAVQVDDASFIATSFPGFTRLMRGLGADFA